MEAIALSLSLAHPTPPKAARPLFRPPPRFVEPPADPRPEPPAESSVRKAHPPTRADPACAAQMRSNSPNPRQSTAPIRPNLSPSRLPSRSAPVFPEASSAPHHPPWIPYAHLPMWRPQITPTLLPRNGRPRPESFRYPPAAFAAYSSLPRASRIALTEEAKTDSDDDDRSDATSTISAAPSHGYQYQGDSRE